MGIERITTDSDGRPVARGLPIRFWDVYRDLTFHALSDYDVLGKYPGLEPEDLTAVREYAVHLIKSRTHDDFTGRTILPKSELIHGIYYKGRCRNATIARWNAEEQCFFHWREKFGRVYIETIKYPTDEVELWWDVFDVVEPLTSCRFVIPFDVNAVFVGNRDDLYEYAKEMWAICQDGTGMQ